MEQEHRITYKAGITRTPSDFLCADGELAECINLTSDSEELKPVVQPAEFITTYEGIEGNHKPELLYIHDVANTKYYFGYLPTDSNKLCYGTVSDKTYTNIRTLETSEFVWQPGTSMIKSVGKTIILTNDTGMHFLMYDPSSASHYGDIIDKIPEPKIRFWLEGGEGKFEFPVNPIIGPVGTYKEWYDANFGFDGDFELPYTVVNEGSSVGIIVDRERNREPRIEKDADEEYNDLIIGLYGKNKRAICQKKAFCEPFFVRYALRLYDDTLYYISNPILMFPSVTRNTYFMYSNDGERLIAFTKFCYLHYELNIDGDLEKFSDIVKDIDIFVSDGMNIYDTTVQQPLITLYGRDEGQTPKPIFDGVYHKKWEEQGDTEDPHSRYRSVTPTIFWHQSLFSGYDGYRIECLQRKDPVEIKKNIKEQALFYKICSVGLRAASGSTSDLIDTHTLENLTNQDRINEDDYYSRCRLYPDFMHVYNSRVNLASVARGFFEGFDFFMPFVTPVSGGLNTGGTYDFYVTIKTDTKEVTVKHTHEATTNEDHVNGIYFFYPDSRAKHVVIMKGNSCIMNQDLKEHGGLNGAYFFRGLPGIDITTEPGDTLLTPAPSYNNNDTEPLENHIVTSDAGDPFVYKAEGYNKVGTGKIIGISETTMALSQDAYGRNDLVVFSESGTWGMSVDRTGLFESIHPFTRDVCINKNSITKVDFGVFFVSKQGLMLLTDKGVICVSERMNGKTFNTSGLSPLATETDWASIVSTCQGNTSFLDYIRDSRCFLAYDYIDSRVLIINHAYGYQYIYNMKDATLSKTILPQVAHAKVESYPDNLLLGTSNVYSFYEKQREEEVSARQLAFLLTRPMKLAGPVSKDSLRQLKNVGYWDKGTTLTPLSCVKTEVYLSDDMLTWYPDISRFGAAAKYYRLALYIKMLPTERLSGTILTEQPRRTNNQR